MVIVTLNQYDGGIAGGDGNLTQQTQYASATDTRVTTFGYDFRDRRTGTTDALNHFVVSPYDNLGRQIVERRFASPTGNLMGWKAFEYDAMGRIYQQRTLAVDPSTGHVGNVLIANMWYDPSGNLLQQVQAGAGQAFTKNTYNGVNWVTASYTGYNTSGVSYSQAGTVANDIIVEQTLNTYDEAGNVISQSSFQRLNDAPSTGTGSTGALSSGTQPQARVSYTAAWFDGIDRTIASANYGAIASFTRPATIPASSSTILVNTVSYDNAARVYQTTDPKGIVAQIGYDAAGRKTQTIEDQGGLNRTTNYTYTLDNLIATMTAVNASTGNQTTTYTYGTTLTSSSVARNDLLASVTYPDSISASDVVSYAYNRLGQQRTITDQRGTVRTLYYDSLGRPTNDCVTTNGIGTDVTVKQIATAYEIRSMVSLIISTDSASQGAGTVLNQVQMTYNSFGQLIQEQQEHGGAVSGSSPNVQYGYDSGASNSNEIRPSTLTYPNGRIITYSYGSTGGMNDLLNRVDTIVDTTGSTNLASYTYLGAGTVIRINYPQPQVWLDLWGGTSGVFTGLDSFNRIIDQRWQNQITTTPADIDRYQYGYDPNSNRTWKANVVGTPVVTGGLDEVYSYDNLNRLTDMQRGVLNGTYTGITGTPTIEKGWTLDPTGNWSNYLTKASGTTDLNQTRTSNPVNEITNITESTGSTWIVPAYDAAGNMTTMPQTATPTSSFTVIYDAWNRMVQVSASATPVVGYEYDGRGRRIVRLAYTSGVLSETRHSYFTATGRDVEQRLGSATSLDQQHVWGIRYIDELVCRDDAVPERFYGCQDANFNVTVLVNSSGGTIAERFVYTPYGVVAFFDSSWTTASYAYNWIYLFQGGRYDPVTGFLRFGERDYGPGLGLWCQRDGGYWGGMNLYQVNDGNPLSRTDPSGLKPEDNAACPCTCIDASMDFTPSESTETILLNPTWIIHRPKWTVYDHNGGRRVGFHIMAHFEVRGDWKKCKYFQNETGSISSHGTSDYFRINPQTQISAVSGKDNPIDNGDLKTKTQSNLMMPPTTVVTHDDPLGSNFVRGGTGSFQVVLNDFTVVMRCVSSDGKTSVESPKYKINSTVDAVVNTVPGDPTLKASLSVDFAR